MIVVATVSPRSRSDTERRVVEMGLCKEKDTTNPDLGKVLLKQTDSVFVLSLYNPHQLTVSFMKAYLNGMNPIFINVLLLSDDIL